MEANFLLRLNGCQLAGGPFQKVIIGSRSVIRRLIKFGGRAERGRLRWSYTDQTGVIEDRP
jgi:hypothetical protein